MLKPELIEHAVDFQQRSYRLLKWIADAVDRGFISFKTAHRFASLPDAARAWMDDHYDNLPPDARPSRTDLGAFVNLFASYLEGSFDLVEEPGHHLYSPDAHCFCPLCSWLIRAPRLRTKRVTTYDKRRARTLRFDALKQLGLDIDCPITDEEANQLVERADLREPSSLVAYGVDLLRRLDDVSQGAATLVLWRGFAWTPSGSPKSHFQLTAKMVLDAEALLVAVLRMLQRDGST